MGPNPFESQGPARGSSFNARNLDHERLYVAWFKIADPGRPASDWFSFRTRSSLLPVAQLDSVAQTVTGEFKEKMQWASLAGLAFPKTNWQR